MRRIASPSSSVWRPRTKRPKTRGNVPNVRGCGRRAPSMPLDRARRRVAADAGERRAHHGGDVVFAHGEEDRLRSSRSSSNSRSRRARGESHSARAISSSASRRVPRCVRCGRRDQDVVPRPFQSSSKRSASRRRDRAIGEPLERRASRPPSRASSGRDRIEVGPARDVRIDVGVDAMPSSARARSIARASGALCPSSSSRRLCGARTEPRRRRAGRRRALRRPLRERRRPRCEVRDVARGAPARRSRRARAETRAGRRSARACKSSRSKRPIAPLLDMLRERATVSAFSSSSLQLAFASPRTLRRVVPSPTRVATFRATPLRVDLVEKLARGCASRPAQIVRGAALRAAARARVPRNGATELPQLPPISVVTPCTIFPSQRGSTSHSSSLWEWTSMKPGASARPRPSTLCARASRSVRQRTDEDDFIARQWRHPC
jgi:hypothetical protein